MVHSKQRAPTPEVSSTTTTTTTTTTNTHTNLNVTGPECIQTIRGHVFQKQVSILCCGESHHEILDLTRVNSIVCEQRTWIDSTEFFGEVQDATIRKEFGILKRKETAFKTRHFRSVDEALRWGEGIVKKEEEEEEDGIVMIWEQGPVEGNDEGLASLYIPQEDDDDDDSDDSDDETTGGTKDIATNSDAPKLFLWADNDSEARSLNYRRVTLEEEISTRELDALIEKRKQNRIHDGQFECWDDWMLRMVSRANDDLDVEVVIEAAIPATDVELHYGSLENYPLAHESVQCLECDSDEDTEDEEDEDDGTGAAMDYFIRRLEEKECVVLHRVDPRSLGDYDDDDDGDEEGDEEVGAVSATAFRSLITHPLPIDAEMEYLTTHNLEYPPDHHSNDNDDDKGDNEIDHYSKALPSWEGYFGAASQLLYYSPHVKADYTPLLSQILKNPKTTNDFFQALYFGTVDEALQILKLKENGEKQGVICLRSLIYKDGEKIYKRPDNHYLIPVRYPPIHCYLKARNTNPPQTWISALQSHLLQVTNQDPDAKSLLSKVKIWYLQSVQYLLQDPKHSDKNGDYFTAYLRAAHRDIYNDIDRSDPEILRRRETMPSLVKGKKKKHKLGGIEIPSVREIFDEWKVDNPEKRASTARDRVLSQIIIDAYQLRMVDVSAIITIARCIASAKSQKIVLVLYMGSEHTQTILEFFQNNMGFNNVGLTRKGLVGKIDNWDDEEPRALKYPDYLHNFDLLFPVPIPLISSKKKKNVKKK